MTTSIYTGYTEFKYCVTAFFDGEENRSQAERFADNVLDVISKSLDSDTELDGIEFDGDAVYVDVTAKVPTEVVVNEYYCEPSDETTSIDADPEDGVRAVKKMVDSYFEDIDVEYEEGEFEID